MNVGDTLVDSTGTQWVLDSLLGRGTWGRVWSLRGQGGAEATLKLAHTSADFEGHDDPAGMATACHRIAMANLRHMKERTYSFLPELLAEMPQADGRVGLIMPRYLSDLEHWLRGGAPLSEVLDLAVRVLHQLTSSTAGGAVHGNLRPSNILIDEHGQLVLADPVVTEGRGAWSALEAATPGRMPYGPPEARFEPAGTWDTFAVCACLYRACMVSRSSDDPRRGLPFQSPREGLSRVELAALRDAASSRLSDESANRRFSHRVTDQLGRILDRGLSKQTEPSPPYRFTRAGDLLDRLVQVDDLIHPAVESVSRILLGPKAKDGVFEGSPEVEFSVNVGTTAGVTAQEDIACGLQLWNRDKGPDGRTKVEASRFSVDRYPSGRWRFTFTLLDIPPGRYDVKVAFEIKGSERQREVAEGRFELRPHAGYVPPVTDPDAPPPPIPLPSRQQLPDVEPEPQAPTVVPSMAPPPSVSMASEDPGPPSTTSPAPAVFAAVSSPPAEYTATSPDVSNSPAPSPVPAPAPIAYEPEPAPQVDLRPTVPQAHEEPPAALPDPYGGFDPQFLQDYPAPGADGTDLPSYDDFDELPTSWWGSLSEQVLRQFRDEPFTALALACGVILILFMIRFLFS